ncbi:hypothetical protein CDD80_3425 [Ophiocordyceps camponoti-rufipedis]|uniref:DBF4-type domain-containing protein n=1 Tax=Ophiocordyceps camponoti-rufipedis TaxID=2004952 RepID=A0A2C5Z3R0_9HYPO|nr:hypothetical protein CDD80_3425 [Ophiocordyceps camponoti-rufipedis]
MPEATSLAACPALMATVSLSPTPAPVTVMSSRRAPLANNPNVINSPLRGASALSCYTKPKRTHASAQRDESYLQQPALKKQALENGGQRPIRSPSKPRPQVLVQRTSIPSARSVTAASKDRGSRALHDNETEAWKKHYRAKFPKMVFYFESIPDDVRAKLTKRVTYFGARQEPFFSIDVTHVITTRTIPPERAEAASQETAASAETDQQRKQQSEEQPQTINPSLLDRTTAARRKLLFEFRQAPSSSQQLKRTGSGNGKPRNNDVLHKAREMGKKIWSLDKFQTMLSVLLDSEAHNPVTSRNSSTRNPYGAAKGSHEPDLLQLLHNERINGPSDRDPTAVNRELIYFKGPYIYVWDMDEKQKPIMARDYPKVANKTDGEWPQFRSVANGRCPFVEDVELIPEKKDCRKSRERERARAAAAVTAAKREDDAAPVLIPKPPKTMPLAKPVTGKRPLSEVEAGGRNKLTSRAATATGPTDSLTPTVSKEGETSRTMQNAFVSRAAACPGRLLAGEPVASGLQPSNVTSAIRSQMISSASGIQGAKAGISKEMHGLQRKVLQKTTTSQDPSSRRLAEKSLDVASSRSMSRQTSRTVHAPDDDGHSHRTAAAANTMTAAAVDSKESKPRLQQALKSKRDLKPGYCENCQEKFPDFDEVHFSPFLLLGLRLLTGHKHIASRKHRKFAENNDNWTELDSLLAQLKRIPKYQSGAESDSDGAVW